MRRREDDRGRGRPQHLPRGTTPQRLPKTGTGIRGWRPRGRSPFLAGTTRATRRRFSLIARRGGSLVMTVLAFVAQPTRPMITPLKAYVPTVRRFRLLLGVSAARTRRVAGSGRTWRSLALRTVGSSRGLAGTVRRTGRSRPWLARTIRSARTGGASLPRAIGGT